MSSTSAPKTSDAGPVAKFAVVRLKPGDNLLGLFQLLIHNGFGEVSFVNNLNETIFPIVTGGAKESSPANTAAKHEHTETFDERTEKAQRVNVNGDSDRRIEAKDGTEKMMHTTRVMPPPTVERYQFIPPQSSAQLRMAIDDHNPARNEPTMRHAAGMMAGIDNAAGDSQRTALNANLSQAISHATQLAASTLPSFAPMPSAFLGLPTMPNLNASAAAAAMVALSEATTPPYTLANFFLPNNLPASVTSVPAPGGTVHQYSPSVLAQHAQGPSAVAPGSPAARAVSSLLSHTNRPQVQSQVQQRALTSQQSYLYHQPQQQLVSATMQHATANRPSAAKVLAHRSPAASPRSGSNSSSNSGHHGRGMDGLLSSSGVPLPPGCATTHLRQRGQRTYAEDPSLYVACRLCKNKIMGSRISNLTNHVRRHSSMKQFQCCYCDYSHNEMAKVRLHMLHNHKDNDSQPIDNLSPEMQASWDLLMKECFPDHCQQQHQSERPVAESPVRQVSSALTTNGFASVLSFDSKPLSANPPSATTAFEQPFFKSAAHSYLNSQNASEVVSKSGLETTHFDDKKYSADLSSLVHRPEPEQSTISPSLSSPTGSSSPETTAAPAANISQQHCVFQCAECGIYVNERSKARHIRKCHLQCLQPFVCSMCGYDHAEHSKVKVHICLKHDDDPAAQVITRDLGTYAEQLVPAYFPISGGIQYAAAVNSVTRDVESAAIGSSVESIGTSHTAANVTPQETPNRRMNMESVIVYGQRNRVGDDGAVTRKPVALVANCVVCSRSVRKKSMVRHVRQHLRAAPMAALCPVCGQYKSNSTVRVLRHMQVKHGVIGNFVKPLRFRRVPIAASSAAFVKLALRRCFRYSIKKTRTLKRGKAVVKRYISQLGEASKRRRKACLFSKQSKTHNQATARLAPNDTTPAANGQAILEPRLDKSTNHQISADTFRLCPLCAHWIRTDQLALHLQAHVQPIGATYRCDLCDFLAPDPMIARAHFIQEHEKRQQQQTLSQRDARQAAVMMNCATICRNTTAAAADG